jgi:hypothetical protein
MLLYEFSPSPLLVKLVAVVSQLKSQIDNGEEKSDWTVDEFLDYLKNNDIILDKSDLYNMIQKPPLNSKISNIQANNVIFKGYDTEAAPEDDNKKIVKQMAKNAIK